MKRRDLIKGLPFLPLAGGMMASALPATAEGLAAGETPLAGPLQFADGQNIFRTIGVEPLINCRGTFTIIGGSLERASVRAAMDAASRSFVQYDELADGIGQQLANITGAQWGMVSAGCAAGLKHVTAACVTGGNPEKLVRIPDLTGLDKTEVIIPRNSRNVYDHAIRNIGVKIITVETMAEFANALNARTAMIYCTSEDGGAVTLEEMAKLAKPKNIPILIDAAAEDLTIPNIHLQRGATIVAYSGGKALCGPQCAGLLLGNKDILMSAWQASSPHHGPGRDNKVGREEMIGMLAAVQAWVALDHKAAWKQWLGWLSNISAKLTKIDGVKTAVNEPKELSNHSPELIVSWDSEKLHITGEEVAEELGKTKPRIALGSGGARGLQTGNTSISITTGQMQPGEDAIVADRIAGILTKQRTAPSKTLKAPAGSLTGRWELTIAFFSSTSTHSLMLEQDENWIQGTHQGEYSTRNVSGTIEGDFVKLRSSDRHAGDNITFTFSGTLSGENLTGNIYMGEYRTAKFTGKKITAKRIRELINVPSGPPLAT